MAEAIRKCPTTAKQQTPAIGARRASTLARSDISARTLFEVRKLNFTQSKATKS